MWAALELAREWALDGSADVGFEFAGPAGSFADLAQGAPFGNAKTSARPTAVSPGRPGACRCGWSSLIVRWRLLRLPPTAKARLRLR